jgi:hypothetical protein
MRSKLAFGTATIAVVLATLAGEAAAASTGSTDIYRNQFRQSFGAPLLSKDLPGFATYLDASTDIWGNEFEESFGASEHRPRSQTAYSNGSTDVWGNGFRASFGDVPLSVSTGPSSMREAPGNMVRQLR